LKVETERAITPCVEKLGNLAIIVSNINRFATFSPL